MVDIRLVEYIELELKKGIREIHIKQALKTVGHNIKIIEEAFEHVRAGHHKRHKHHVKIGGVIVLAIIIGVAFMQTDVFDKGVKFEENKELDVMEEVLSDGELYNQAVASGNILMCDQIDDEQYRAKCLMHFSDEDSNPQKVADNVIYERALSEGNPELCASVAEESLRLSCDAFFVVPEAEEEPSSLGEGSDEAIYEQAISEGNPELCTTITEESLRLSCDAFFVVPEAEEEPSSLAEGSDEELYEQALTTNNPSLCEQITEEDLKLSCSAFFS